jgi:Uma2 family endonuclease
MMTIIESEKQWTAEAYLERERKTLREIGGKYEFYKLKPIETAHCSTVHNTVVSNLSYVFLCQIRSHKSNHIVLSSDQKVEAVHNGKNYFYPDLTIVEGRPFSADEHNDILLNPSILIEVLSDSTESFDRGDKFRSYRQINSLKEYILIAQDEQRIEHFFKDENGRWQIGEVISEGSLVLISPPFELAIEDVYHNVFFEEK